VGRGSGPIKGGVRVEGRARFGGTERMGNFPVNTQWQRSTQPDSAEGGDQRAIPNVNLGMEDIPETLVLWSTAERAWVWIGGARRAASAQLQGRPGPYTSPPHAWRRRPIQSAAQLLRG